MSNLPQLELPVMNAISPPTVAVPSCCSPPSRMAATGTIETGTKCHFSLNVASLEASVAFYRVLFNVPPAKLYPDYAKFELDLPPLVFSLVPNPPAGGGALSHFGFPVGSTDEVEAVAQRLAAAGLSTSCQKDTVCGYARQDKVWVADPDQNYWEVYVVHEDVDPETVRSSFDGADLPRLDFLPPSPTTAATPVSTIWEHRVLEAVPIPIPRESGSVDEVRLEGTFNATHSQADRQRFLKDVLRILKPGGRVKVHGLVSDRPLAVKPALPGVASLVERVPVQSEPLDELRDAGFIALHVTKLPESPVFRDGEAEMREIKFEALKPVVEDQSGATRSVVYKGPFAEAVDGQGHTFRRGQRTPIPLAAWNTLFHSAAAPQFVFLGFESEADRTCG